MTDANITTISLKLFLTYAEDANNWNGSPPVGDARGDHRAHRGNLTQLKQAGLIRTEQDEGLMWIVFTETGKSLAKQHGIVID